MKDGYGDQYNETNSITISEIVSSSLETFSFVQDLTTPSECIPKPVIFRPDYPSNLRIRCQPFGADDPKSSPSVERHHKKSKKEKKRKRLKTEYDDN
ncbi:unnamed protein product [Didymodactylos carnosus]|uniref:Uncharacterized protein n=1 Tax=Didymodactylos carnosus TaxID=1234261 RepID=A0A813YN37_9BILA|nr:unnamed protein product [Didymodactylos carnosus]CAF0895640.1 unnamed protein product [Didymodactylos carnosus]CAF3671766.1 unnamed protein product [Didymodactylos carnosus]CAF3677182.1 unnamed protein product [Didymodactylos carnosus]